jgi:hypothetical protein
MELESLARRLDAERGTERSSEEVFMVDSRGLVAPVLSLNWDGEHGRWLLIADHYDWAEG